MTTYCCVKHELHEGNTGWWRGKPLCLDCVALANEAKDEMTRIVVAAILEVGPLPSRIQVGAA